MIVDDIEKTLKLGKLDVEHRKQITILWQNRLLKNNVYSYGNNIKKNVMNIEWMRIFWIHDAFIKNLESKILNKMNSGLKVNVMFERER
jgi:hypothetical protein